MKKQFLLIASALLLMTVFSCKEQIIEEQKEITPVQSSSNSNARESVKNSDEIVLGKKLQNPFSVENMQIAYENLKKGGSNKQVKISPTHLYIRFLPNNEKEYKTINSDPNFILFDHPLDYEIAINGNRYKDVETKDLPYTWYYCSLPVDYKYDKSIKHDVLAKLYIPETQSNDAFAKELENEAMRITNNSTNTKNGRVSAFNPSGRVTYIDNVLGTVGLEGAKVFANRWFTTYTAISDVNGNYLFTESFDNPCNYSIKWERADFDLLLHEGSSNVQAYTNGPKQSTPWICNMTTPMEIMISAAHRAANRYYYKNTILRTPRNGTFLSRLSIALYTWENVSPNADHQTSAFIKSWLDFPDIRIFKPSRGAYALFSTTIHELTHASHWAMDRANFRNSDDVILESWARGVQWFFTNNEYPGTNWGDGAYGGGIQRINPTVADGYQNVYSPIFIDLMDNVNQRTVFFDNSLPNDNANSYQIRQLEDILIGSKTLLNLRNNVFNTYPANASRGNLNTLFNGYGIN